MRLNLDPDETDASGSSSEAADRSESGEQDVNLDGKDSSADAESSADKGDKELSLEETLQAHLDKVDKEKPPTSEEDDAEGDVSKTNNTEEEAKDKKKEDSETVEGEDENAPEDEQEVAKDPIPYERFHEKVQEVAEKTNEVARLTPLAKRGEIIQNYQQTNGINDNELVDALEFAKLLKTDPETFAKKMMPVLEGIGYLTGDKLPDDLAKQAAVIKENVESGALPKETADVLLNGLKETAKLRAQLKYGGERQKLTEQQRQQQAIVENNKALADALTGWATSVNKKDPSFKPKTNGEADGLFEMVDAKMTHLQQMRDAENKLVHPVRTPADMVKLAQMAYDAVTKSSFFRTKAPVRRGALSSNGSRNNDVSDGDFLKEKELGPALEKGLAALRAGKRPY
jgi:hypothetical protein